jgi:dTMP kinase
LDWVDKFEYDELHIPRPDAVVYIDMPPEIAQLNVDKKSAEQRAYAGGKKRDIHEADLNHLKDSAAAYNYVADKFGRLKLDPAPN